MYEYNKVINISWLIILFWSKESLSQVYLCHESSHEYIESNEYSLYLCISVSNEDYTKEIFISAYICGFEKQRKQIYDH